MIPVPDSLNELKTQMLQPNPKIVIDNFIPFEVLISNFQIILEHNPTMILTNKYKLIEVSTKRG